MNNVSQAVVSVEDVKFRLTQAESQNTRDMPLVTPEDVAAVSEVEQPPTPDSLLENLLALETDKASALNLKESYEAGIEMKGDEMSA